MGSEPLPQIESNNSEINNCDIEISHSNSFIYSMTSNRVDFIQPNFSSSTSSNIINKNSNNNTIIDKGEKEKDIIVLIDNSNKFKISNNDDDEAMPKNNNYINNNSKTISKNNNYHNKKRPKHDKLAKDNIKRKINVYYSKFVCSLLNEIIKKILNEKIQFYQLSHSFTKKVTRTAFTSLKKKSLGYIFKKYVSPRYKKHKNWKKLNTGIYKKVTSKSKILKKILKKPYFEFFKDFAFHNTILNLSKYGLNENILLSNNNNYFDDLKKNNQTDDSIADKKYFNKMAKILNRDFLSFPIFQITKLYD